MQSVLFRSASAAVVALALAGCTSDLDGSGIARPTSSTSTRTVATTSAPATHSSSSATHPPATTSTTTPAPALAGLPLPYSTGDATQVITVTATSASSTTATLRVWQKSGGGWHELGSPLFAHIGSAGMTTHPSEDLDAAPIGSYTLTQAFGALANPGTSLPYRRTDLADWWISEWPNPLYNTLQHCASSCAFTSGEPNEHLRTITPQYNYAVVIDYNTRNSPTGVHDGAGSAFFLHVTDGTATAGCVAIPQENLATILKWLSPSAHPRILIGVT